MLLTRIQSGCQGVVVVVVVAVQLQDVPAGGVAPQHGGVVESVDGTGLALLLADNDRAGEALGPLEQLLLHFPHHIKALILMGDIYTNNKKDLNRAESCYRRYSNSDYD